MQTPNTGRQLGDAQGMVRMPAFLCQFCDPVHTPGARPPGALGTSGFLLPRARGLPASRPGTRPPQQAPDEAGPGRMTKPQHWPGQPSHLPGTPFSEGPTPLLQPQSELPASTGPADSAPSHPPRAAHQPASPPGRPDCLPSLTHPRRVHPLQAEGF